MKKTLLAVAAMLAVGGVFAQSTVTMSGIFKAGVGNTKYANGASQNGSGMQVIDGSSRLIIGFNEDLGGGLRAIGQFDIRMRVDDNGGAGAAPTTAVASQLATGNTFIGLRGGFGTLRLGKLDTHYCLGSDTHGTRSTALSASSCAILGYVGGVGLSIANASRSLNLIRYDLPTMGGLTGGVTYSTAFQSTEGLLSGGATGDKGSALNVNGAYAAGPVSIALSYWNAKNEAKVLIQKAGTAAVNYNFGIGTVGLTVDKSHSGNLGAEAVRTALSVPVTFRLGAGTLLATYTRAGDVKGRGTTGTIANSGATAISVGYDYALSKRTSIGVSFVNLANETFANYQLYTMAGLGGIASGTNAGATLNNQDQRQLYFGIRNAF